MNTLEIAHVQPLPPAIGMNVRPVHNACGSAATLGTHAGKMVPFRWKLLASASQCHVNAQPTRLTS